MNSKKKFFLTLFFFEIILVFTFFCFGSSGIKKIISLKRDNSSLHNEVQALENEVKSLEDVINQWNTYAFYKEKIAREQLQMARNDESIYYFS